MMLRVPPHVAAVSAGPAPDGDSGAVEAREHREEIGINLPRIVGNHGRLHGCKVPLDRADTNTLEVKEGGALVRKKHVAAVGLAVEQAPTRTGDAGSGPGQ